MTTGASGSLWTGPPEARRDYMVDPNDTRQGGQGVLFVAHLCSDRVGETWVVSDSFRSLVALYVNGGEKGATAGGDKPRTATDRPGGTVHVIRERSSARPAVE